MRSKRSNVTKPVGAWVGAFAMLLASSASAAKDDKKKDAAAEHKGGLMEEGGKDPAETEGLDEDGQFVPGKKKKKAPRAEGEEGEEGASEEGAASEGEGEDEKKAEEAPKKAPKPRKSLGVFADVIIGFGEAPVPGPGDPTTGDATSFGFLIGGFYDFATMLRGSLRMPWTTVSVTDSKGQSSSANALGAPEMAGRLKLTEGDTEWAVRLAVGIPVAQGNPDVTDTQDTVNLQRNGVQRIADGASGWHDPELFQPKRLPVTPALLVTHRADKFRLNAELKAVFLPKLGGTIKNQEPNPSVGKYDINSLSLAAVVGATASYEVLERKHLALAAWATYWANEPVIFTSKATDPSPLQIVLEPKILAQFGRVVPSVGFLIPAGGQLGGNIMGLRLHVDVVF